MRVEEVCIILTVLNGSTKLSGPDLIMVHGTGNERNYASLCAAPQHTRDINPMGLIIMITQRC